MLCDYGVIMKQIEGEIIQEFQRQVLALTRENAALQLRCIQAEASEREVARKLARTNDELNQANNELARIRMAQTSAKK